jgi:hypothetical protein
LRCKVAGRCALTRCVPPVPGRDTTPHSSTCLNSQPPITSLPRVEGCHRAVRGLSQEQPQQQSVHALPVYQALCTAGTAGLLRALAFPARARASLSEEMKGARRRFAWASGWRRRTRAGRGPRRGSTSSTTTRRRRPWSKSSTHTVSIRSTHTVSSASDTAASYWGGKSSTHSLWSMIGEMRAMLV